jgi:hypothetical protein
LTNFLQLQVRVKRLHGRRLAKGFRTSAVE